MGGALLRGSTLTQLAHRYDGELETHLASAGNPYEARRAQGTGWAARRHRLKGVARSTCTYAPPLLDHRGHRTCLSAEAAVRNQITIIEPRVLHYLSDTQPGSSGSLLLEQQRRLAGLHHAGGRPQEVAGKRPVLKKKKNRIGRVLAGLGQLRIQVR